MQYQQEDLTKSKTTLASFKASLKKTLFTRLNETNYF